MQDKIIVIYNFPNGTNNPIEIPISLMSEFSTDPIFLFREYETIDISFKSSDYILQIEGYSYKIGSNFHTSEDNSIYIHNDEKIRISESGNDNLTYRPDRYVLNILDSKGLVIKTGYFKVSYNKEMSDNGMCNIIANIEKFINSLSLDFFHKGPVNSLLVPTDQSKFFKYEILERNKAKILKNANLIFENMRTFLKKEIYHSSYEKKQNLDSIRKNIFKRNQNIIYSYRKTTNYFTPENLLLKKYLMRILKLLNNSKSDLSKLISEKKVNIVLNQKKKEDAQKTLISLKSNYSHSNFDFVNTQNSIRNFDSLIIEDEKWLTKFEDWQDTFNKVKSVIKKVVFSTEFKDISLENQLIYSNIFMSKKEYKFFYDLYNGLISNSSISDSKNKNFLFSNKSSYKLYEIYGFIVIDNIFKDLGFSLVNTNNDIFSFMSDAQFIFEKNDIKVIVQYDHMCSRSTLDVSNEIVTINSRNCKPDYIISIYKNDAFVNAMVVEIKYRSLFYMKTNVKNMSSETDSTLNDYAQLAYKDSKGKLRRAVVEQVVVLYPSKEEFILESPSGLGKYIGLNSEINFSLSKGYNELKSILSNMIA